VAREDALIGEDDALHAAVAFEADRRAVRVDGDVVLFEESAGPACGGFAGEAGPGVLVLNEQVDLEAHLRQGGGELEAEESGAEDGGAASVGGCAARVASAFGFGFVDGIVKALEVVGGG